MAFLNLILRLLFHVNHSSVSGCLVLSYNPVIFYNLK